MPGLALLANPESGSGEAAMASDALRERAGRLGVFALDEAESAVDFEPERIVVAGGDGSLGCAAEAAAKARVPLAVIPVGTANDFARAMGIPRETGAAIRLAVEGSKTRRLDIARMGGRPFLNVASVGLAPLAARRAHGWKRVLGPLAYAVGAIRAAFEARPVPCRVTCDGEELFSGRVWQATVACSGAFGGGAGVDADPRDGRLDVVVIEAGSRASLVVRGYGLRQGTIGSQRGVHTCRAVTVGLEVPPDTSFNVDGEIVSGVATRFEIEPAAVEVVVG